MLLYGQAHIPGAVMIDWQGDLQDQLRSRLHQRRQVRRLVLEGRDRQRHDRRLLRRQVELVGLLRVLGVQALWARRLPDLERRPQALARPEAADDDRDPQLSGDPVQGRAAARKSGSAIFRDAVAAHAKAGLPLIDVRSPKEFTGEMLHMEAYPQEGALRGGHIPARRTSPGAGRSTKTARSSRSPSSKRSTKASVGLKPNDDVVAYCRIGERSSLTWFVLTYLLGYPNVRNYDGSWTEWGNLVRAPIAKGA